MSENRFLNKENRPLAAHEEKPKRTEKPKPAFERRAFKRPYLPSRLPDAS